MMTDPISDLLTRIRNACMVRKGRIEVPFSRMKQDILEILKQEGYIEEYAPSGEGARKMLDVTLRYVGRTPVIHAVKRISKPGCRIYAKSDVLPIVLNNRGIAILSTSKGVMTNKTAKRLSIGGEIICEVS
ncbi:MAG: 30S ribosomal protein S8 [Patescibacteria group bacterium]